MEILSQFKWALPFYEYAPMTVISADTQNEILFDKDVLRYHPLTKLNYKPGTITLKVSF